MGKNIFREIVVDCDGELLISVDGVLSSDNKELIKQAQRNSLLRTPVQLVAPFGETFESNLDDGDAFGEVAALMGVRPGRSRLLAAPKEVMDYIEESLKPEDGEDSDNIVY